MFRPNQEPLIRLGPQCLTKTPFQMNQLPPKKQGEDQGYTGGQLTQHA